MQYVNFRALVSDSCSLANLYGLDARGRVLARRLSGGSTNIDSHLLCFSFLLNCYHPVDHGLPHNINVITLTAHLKATIL